MVKQESTIENTERDNIVEDIWNVITDYEEDTITLEEAVDLIADYTERRVKGETGPLFPRR